MRLNQLLGPLFAILLHSIDTLVSPQRPCVLFFAGESGKKLVINRMKLIKKQPFCAKAGRENSLCKASVSFLCLSFDWRKDRARCKGDSLTPAGQSGSGRRTICPSSSVVTAARSAGPSLPALSLLLRVAGIKKHLTHTDRRLWEE
jgi:hypothetical protein